MLFTGSQLIDAQAAMSPASIDSVFHRIREDRTLREDTLQLRKIRNLDAGAYSRMKTRLPYFCCGQFRAGLRKSAHFESIQSWIIDIDHISDNQADLEMLRQRLKADERVALLFMSPGGDGLKVLFLLDSPCTDTKRFSESYKSFAFALGEQYGITDCIDFKTADVTRVCFLAHDPLAYINVICDRVVWESWLPEKTQPLLFSIDKPEEKTQEKPGKSHAIHPEVYGEILKKLKSKNPVLPAAQRPVFIPEALDLALPAIRQTMESNGIEVFVQRPIQYGYQLTLRCGNDQTDVNLFYGKRGFSVVLVERKNTNLSLGELTVFLIEQTLYGRNAWYGSDPGETMLGDGKKIE